MEQSSQTQGRETTKLTPADRVVSGDSVIYTLEVRNTATDFGAAAGRDLRRSRAHDLYGRFGGGSRHRSQLFGRRRPSFDAPENLRIQEPGGNVARRHGGGLYPYPLAAEKCLERQFGGVCAFRAIEIARVRLR